jgi:hypothetical protein
MISHSIDGRERFTVDDPVRISKDATYDPFGWNKPEPHPYAGESGFYTGLRNSTHTSQVAVLCGEQKVYVEEHFLESRELTEEEIKERTPKEPEPNEDGPVQVQIIG